MTTGNQQLPQAPWRPAVVLRHVLPDGSWHYDLLIAQENTDQLWSLRLSQDVDLQAHAPFAGVVLPPHRAVYLTYEGPVRGGELGSVVRVLKGEALLTFDPSFTLVLRWEGHAPQKYLGSLVNEQLRFDPAS